MGKQLSRRNFFGEALRAGFQSLAETASCLEPRSEPESEAMVDLPPEFTPELLAMEAERLHLDPVQDRNEILRSVFAALGRPGSKSSVS